MSNKTSKQRYIMFNPHKWQTKETKLLSLEEKGFFMDLVCLVFDKGGYLDLKKKNLIARLLNTKTDDLDNYIALYHDLELCSIKDDILSIDLITKAIEDYNKLCEKNRKNAMKKGNKKKAETPFNKLIEDYKRDDDIFTMSKKIMAKFPKRDNKFNLTKGIKACEILLQGMIKKGFTNEDSYSLITSIVEDIAGNESKFIPYPQNYFEKYYNFYVLDIVTTQETSAEPPTEPTYN